MWTDESLGKTSPNDGIIDVLSGVETFCCVFGKRKHICENLFEEQEGSGINHA
jgi:hypothetical protein